MIRGYNITQQGQRHIDEGRVCQDYSALQKVTHKSGTEYIIAAVSDGVGSCAFSQLGARVAVECSVKYIEENLMEADNLYHEAIMSTLQHAFQAALKAVEEAASDSELPFIQYDCTLTVTIYDGHTMWFGHIGDDGIVVLYANGSYEKVSTRHKGDLANSVIPLRVEQQWEFGFTTKEVASFVIMTDGILDYCVDSVVMHERVYFPFLKPALTSVLSSDEVSQENKEYWDLFLSGKDPGDWNFRTCVTDDISFVVVQNPELVQLLPPIEFDEKKWKEDTEKRKKELDALLYGDYRTYRKKAEAPPAPPADSSGRSDNSATSTVNPVPAEADPPVEELYDEATEAAAGLADAVSSVFRVTKKIGKKIIRQVKEAYQADLLDEQNNED